MEKRCRPTCSSTRSSWSLGSAAASPELIGQASLGTIFVEPPEPFGCIAAAPLDDAVYDAGVVGEGRIGKDLAFSLGGERCFGDPRRGVGRPVSEEVKVEAGELHLVVDRRCFEDPRLPTEEPRCLLRRAKDDHLFRARRYPPRPLLGEETEVRLGVSGLT